MPTGVSFTQSGELVDDMMARYECLRVSDLAYDLMVELVGCRPFGPLWGRQHLACHGADDKADGICGIRGNPTPVGFMLPIEPGGSAIELNGTDTPHWGVWFHEFGHNFMGASRAVGQAAAHVRRPAPSRRAPALGHQDRG